MEVRYKRKVVHVTDTPGLNDPDQWKEFRNMSSVFEKIKSSPRIDLLIFLFNWSNGRMDQV
jgi:hypothetical protein